MINCVKIWKLIGSEAEKDSATYITVLQARCGWNENDSWRIETDFLSTLTLSQIDVGAFLSESFPVVEENEDFMFLTTSNKTRFVVNSVVYDFVNWSKTSTVSGYRGADSQSASHLLVQKPLFCDSLRANLPFGFEKQRKLENKSIWMKYFVTSLGNHARCLGNPRINLFLPVFYSHD